MYIYFLIDPTSNKVRYVGKTHNAHKRLREHCYKQRGESHRAHWLNRLRSLNLKPIMQIIEECDELIWAEREQYWIKYYRELGCDLVNATDGGDGAGKGCKNALDYRHTEEAKRKMSLSRLGHKVTEETRQKLRKVNTGKRHSKETKDKLREIRLKQNDPRLGCNHRQETKERLSQINKGKVLSQETKQKIKIASRGKNSKLTHDQVRAIKQCLLNGDSSTSIANYYGVSRSAIADIRYNRTWAWVI